MRIWFKEWKNNRLLRDTVVEDHSEETRTHKVLKAVDSACRELDLSRPIWLDSTQQDFLRHARARFTQDAFIDAVDFDFLEIHVIEED
ncbi:hypothetical protein [Lachnoclostridium sp. Marseille-P6806]|uniref:hypothetical protein n=1 Tax=Lachnoclostridium sp. Marseille-P6806 TaxID=2364793 RepID=UPI001031474A|nr:hypothetical protein [Lachnoclostridium sp. Marseille-P6806]